MGLDNMLMQTLAIVIEGAVEQGLELSPIVKVALVELRTKKGFGDLSARALRCLADLCENEKIQRAIEDDVNLIGCAVLEALKAKGVFDSPENVDRETARAALELGVLTEPEFRRATMVPYPIGLAARR